MAELVNYLFAMEDNNHNGIIKILTSIIDKTPSNNKAQMILLLKGRIKAYFRMVLNDCIKLASMGYITADDEQISIIEGEAEYRVAKQKAVKNFNNISNKFKQKKIANWASNLDAIDEDKMFDKYV
ncbi:unnamed protein product [Rotaria sp. Silwood1]|nr:unnamed protein product [Rotaria sp. Silwood1]